MRDLRHFYNLLATSKEQFPEKASLIESIEGKFNSLFETITVRQKASLRQYPLQYINKIKKPDGWTSQIHCWAEEGVKDILNLDPMLLSYKNSYGDTVLMSFARGATGSLTDKVNYDLIKDLLSKDYVYQEPSTDVEGNVTTEEKSTLDETDLSGQTILDYLIDIAFCKGDYSDEEPDLELQKILMDTFDLSNEEGLGIAPPVIEEQKENMQQNPNELKEFLSEKEESPKENDNEIALVTLLNAAFTTCQPMKYSDFNKLLVEKESGTLEKLEEDNAKLGIRTSDKENGLTSISTLSLIATITDYLVGKRLKFLVDDYGYIVGVSF